MAANGAAASPADDYDETLSTSEGEEEQVAAASAVVTPPATQEIHIDVNELHPLHPEVISKQATINIGKHHSQKEEPLCLFALVAEALGFASPKGPSGT
jgi:hypothetical protein